MTLPPARPNARPNGNGFTLIELLVALTIFAMLSVAGVMLMRGSVTVQGSVDEYLDAQARVMRTRAVLRQDFEQAVPRVTRTESGLLAPAFFARRVNQGDPVILLVRSGWSNLDGAGRPSLQRVEYLFRNGRLERRTYPQLDGAQPQDAALLLDGIDELDIAYRSDDGTWVEEWQRPEAADLPAAVRLMVKLRGGERQIWLFLVAPGEGRRSDEMPVDADQEESVPPSYESRQEEPEPEPQVQPEVVPEVTGG